MDKILFSLSKVREHLSTGTNFKEIMETFMDRVMDDPAVQKASKPAKVSLLKEMLQVGVDGLFELQFPDKTPPPIQNLMVLTVKGSDLYYGSMFLGKGNGMFFYFQKSNQGLLYFHEGHGSMNWFTRLSMSRVHMPKDPEMN
jgi:hypothetical protein